MKHLLFCRPVIWLLTACFLVALFTSSVFGNKISRTALVIGNSDYKTTPLQNPVNDARDMADALTISGFQVVLLENADRTKMRHAIREFEKELGKHKGIGLFYYAGHGIQLKGKNYLVPIGADIQREYEVPDETIQADAVLQAMDYANNELNIIILDACRNNPFPRSFRSASRGLARMETMGSGMLIAYATSPGAVALDGEGENGIYTKHLLETINTPGLSIEQVFKHVRQKVMKETNMNQTPWEESSLTGDFYFIATDNARININQISPTPASSFTSQNQEEVMFWQGISTSNKKSDYEAYLKKYPDGVFAGLARSRLTSLTSSSPQQIEIAQSKAVEKTPQAELPHIAEQLIGVWRHTYTENNKENYLQFTFVRSGVGNAQEEEPDNTWWASPFQWNIMKQTLTLQYRDNTEKYQVVSLDKNMMFLVGVEGESKNDSFSMQKIHEGELKTSIPVQEKQFFGSWKETWEEDGKVSYQIFTFRSDGSVLEVGSTPEEKWSQESRWKVTDNILQILGDEKQEYRVVNIAPNHLDLIDVSTEYMGEGARFYRVEE